MHAITTMIQNNFEVVAFDSSNYAPGLKVPGLKAKFVDESIENSEEHYVTFLKNLGKQFPNSILLTGDDDTSLVVSKYQKELKEYYHFLVPDYQTFKKITDKYLLSKIVKESNFLNTPLSLEIPEVGDHDLSYPIMIKPKFGVGGRKQIKCHTETVLKSFIESTKNLDDYFVQEYISGPISNLFTVALLTDTNSNPVCAFTANRLNVFRSKQIPEGPTTFIKSIYLEQPVQDSIDFLKQIKWIGIAELEFKKDTRDNQLKLLEINPRLWSWTKLATLCGVNFPYHYVKAITNPDYITGENNKIFNFMENVYYLRLLSDLYSNCYRLLIGEWSLIHFLEQYFFRINKAISGELFIEKHENMRWIYYYLQKRKSYL